MTPANNSVWYISNQLVPFVLTSSSQDRSMRTFYAAFFLSKEEEYLMVTSNLSPRHEEQ